MATPEEIKAAVAIVRAEAKDPIIGVVKEFLDELDSNLETPIAAPVVDSTTSTPADEVRVVEVKETR